MTFFVYSVLVLVLFAVVVGGVTAIINRSDDSEIEP